MQALLGGLMGGGQPQMPQMPQQPQEQREDQAKWQKFEAPPNEMLDKEESYKDMKPTSRDLSRFIQKNLQSAIVHAGTKEERAVYQQIAKQMEVDESKEKFTDLYNETFIQWLLGKSHFNRSRKDLYIEWMDATRTGNTVVAGNNPDGTTLAQKLSYLETQPTFEKFLEKLEFNPTPWGNKDISFLPGCKEFLDGIVDKRAEVEKYFAKMALNGPRNITDAWMIYKYMVNKNEIDDMIIDYAKAIIGPYELPSKDQTPMHVYETDGVNVEEVDVQFSDGYTPRVANQYTYKYYYLDDQDVLHVNTSFSRPINANEPPLDVPPPYSLSQTKQKSVYLQTMSKFLGDMRESGNPEEIKTALEMFTELKKHMVNQFDPLEAIYFDMDMTNEVSSMIKELVNIADAQGITLQGRNQMIQNLMRIKTVYPEIKFASGADIESFHTQGNIAANIEASLQRLGETIINHLRQSGLRHPADNGDGLNLGPGGPTLSISRQLKGINGTIRRLAKNNPSRAREFKNIETAVKDIARHLGSGREGAFGDDIDGMIDDEDEDEDEDEEEEEEEEEEEQQQQQPQQQPAAEEPKKKTTGYFGALASKFSGLFGASKKAGDDVNNIIEPAVKNLEKDIVKEAVKQEVDVAVGPNVVNFVASANPNRGDTSSNVVPPILETKESKEIVKEVTRDVVVQGISDQFVQILDDIKNGKPIRAELTKIAGNIQAEGIGLLRELQGFTPQETKGKYKEDKDVLALYESCKKAILIGVHNEIQQNFKNMPKQDALRIISNIESTWDTRISGLATPDSIDHIIGKERIPIESILANNPMYRKEGTPVRAFSEHIFGKIEKSVPVIATEVLDTAALVAETVKEKENINEIKQAITEHKTTPIPSPTVSRASAPNATFGLSLIPPPSTTKPMSGSDLFGSAPMKREGFNNPFMVKHDNTQPSSAVEKRKKRTKISSASNSLLFNELFT
jgi:hypothetical protein